MDPLTIALLVGAGAGAGSLFTKDKTTKQVLGGISLAGLGIGGAGALGAFGGGGAAAGAAGGGAAATGTAGPLTEGLLNVEQFVPGIGGITPAAGGAAAAGGGSNLLGNVALASTIGSSLGNLSSRGPAAQTPAGGITPPTVPPPQFEPTATQFASALTEDQRRRRLSDFVG